MNRLLKSCFGALVCAASLAVAASDVLVPTRDEFAANWSAKGLQPVDADGLDLLVARPGVSLAPYRAIMLKPVYATFKKNWERYAAIPTGTRIRSRDVGTLRKTVGAAVYERLALELHRGGYVLVGAPGPDVLEIEVLVVDVVINAPDLSTTSPVDSYTTYFGEATLVGAVRDSVTGETLMGVHDRSVGREAPTAQLTTGSDNVFEVGIVAGQWGRALDKQFALAGLAHGGSNDQP